MHENKNKCYEFNKSLNIPVTIHLKKMIANKKVIQTQTKETKRREELQKWK